MVDISAGGTSPASAAVHGTVGTPGPPVVAKTVQSNHGITVSFSVPAANGRPISNFRMPVLVVERRREAGHPGTGQPADREEHDASAAPNGHAHSGQRARRRNAVKVGPILISK